MFQVDVWLTMTEDELWYNKTLANFKELEKEIEQEIVIAKLQGKSKAYIGRLTGKNVRLINKIIRHITIYSFLKEYNETGS